MLFIHKYVILTIHFFPQQLWQTFEAAATKVAKREGDIPQPMDLQAANLTANGYLQQYFVPVSAAAQPGVEDQQKGLPPSSTIEYQAALPTNIHTTMSGINNVVQTISAEHPQSSTTYTPSIGKNTNIFLCTGINAGALPKDFTFQ